jgi:hypothetical protein
MDVKRGSVAAWRRLALLMLASCSEARRWGCDVKTLTLFNLLCPCGHRGCVVQSADENAVPAWHFNFVRSLSHTGDYEGLDPIFADVKPACPDCGTSLGPEHIVARLELPVAGGNMSGAVADGMLASIGLHNGRETG